MTSKLYHLGSGSLLAIAIAGSAPAMAAGTTAGSTITNTATINYQVGGVAQPAINDSDAFVVDRKIDLTVAEVGNATTTVVPGESGAVTTFTVTNTSNAVLDFALTTTQTSGGTASHGGTDNYDVTGVTLYRETGTVAGFDPTDAVVTYLDEVAADAIVTVYVVANVPLGQATNDVANIRLIATGREGGGASSQGAALTQTVGANTAGMDTVFADAAGVADGARDAAHSDDDDYTVSTATLTLDKRSTVISDPVNGTTDPKLIPGAVVEYCIAVSNAAGGAAANAIAVSDILPATLTYVANSIRLDGTTTGLTCNADGSAGGSFASGTVSGTITTVAAGDTRTLVFRATVN
jgi:uncharacterized repeat protein (TIGR01451 family)